MPPPYWLRFWVLSCCCIAENIIAERIPSPPIYCTMWASYNNTVVRRCGGNETADISAAVKCIADSLNRVDQATCIERAFSASTVVFISEPREPHLPLYFATISILLLGNVSRYDVDFFP